MGRGSWSADDWKSYATDTKRATAKSVDSIYRNRSLPDDLNPHLVTMRESRDSDGKDNTNAIIIGLDVTGSMDNVLMSLAKDGIRILCSDIYERNIVTNPHIMLMGIGDEDAGDKAPLQVTQFEADIRVVKELDKLYFERGGGGNGYETYQLAWEFAADKTSIDCFEKRNKRGYLFTIGDEPPQKEVHGKSTLEVYKDVNKKYNVYHVIIEEGDYCRRHKQEVITEWRKLLGNNCLLLSDHTKLAEVVISAILLNETKDVMKLDYYDDATNKVIRHAIGYNE